MSKREIILVASTIPEDIEEWSESLTPPNDAEWIAGLINNSVYLDTIRQFSGNACIGGIYDYYQPANPVYINLHLHLPWGIDVSQHPIFNFLQKLELQPAGFTGECLVKLGHYLTDEYRYLFNLSKWYYLAPGPGWSSLNFNLYDMELYVAGDYPYPVTHEDVMRNTNHIEFLAVIDEFTVQQGIVGQRMCLDRLYFSQPASYLQVRSEPPGKSFTFDGYQFTTPKMFSGTPGSEHEIVMSDTTFKQWENGSRDRVRIVEMPPSGETEVITAYYEGGEQPPQEPGPPSIISAITPQGAVLAGLSAFAIIESVMVLGGKR